MTHVTQFAAYGTPHTAYTAHNIHSTVLYCTILSCTIRYCTVLQCTVLYLTVLFYSILDCILCVQTVELSAEIEGLKEELEADRRVSAEALDTLQDLSNQVRDRVGKEMLSLSLFLSVFISLSLSLSLSLSFPLSLSLSLSSSVIASTTSLEVIPSLLYPFLFLSCMQLSAQLSERDDRLIQAAEE